MTVIKKKNYFKCFEMLSVVRFVLWLFGKIPFVCARYIK